MSRKINAKGLALIKSFEGLKLEAYLCPANVWTIGYGSTGRHVKPGMVITEVEAEALLKKDLRRFEIGVEAAVEGVPTSSNEFSAFVSLAFNIGLAGFRRSTALRRHLASNKRGAADAILMWNKAGGRVLKGLVRRREAERKLYLEPDAVEAPPAPATPAPAPVTPSPVPVPPAGCLAALLMLFKR